MKYMITLAVLLVISVTGCQRLSKGQVSEISNDWTGNEIKIEALTDEKVQGVTCHMAHFDRSVIDRLQKGDWFENPSNGSISCAITGPIIISDISRRQQGEEVFRQSQSLIFKKLTVRRIYDAPNNTLIYLVYSRRIVDGSAKMSLATVSLQDADVTFVE